MLNTKQSRIFGFWYTLKVQRNIKITKESTYLLLSFERFIILQKTFRSEHNIFVPKMKSFNLI